MVSHSVVSDSFPPRGPQPAGSSVHGFSRQEYWSALSFPSPWDHTVGKPDDGAEPETSTTKRTRTVILRMSEL